MQHLFGCMRKAACQREDAAAVAAALPHGRTPSRTPRYVGESYPSGARYSYVGEGQGGYKPNHKWQYRGEGGGDYNVATETRPQYRVRPCCKGLVACLAIVVIGLAGFAYFRRADLANLLAPLGNLDNVRRQAVSVLPQQAMPVQTAPPQDAVRNQTSSSPGEGCDAVCEAEGEPATCRVRVNGYMLGAFAGHKSACTAAHAEVMKRCGASCSSCTLKSIGCTATEANALDENVGPASEGCSAACSFEGQTATCRHWIRSRAGNESVFGGKPWHEACQAAHGRVLEHCPSCAACGLPDADCSPGELQLPHEESIAAAEPFDCDVERADWQHEWSGLKKRWCCDRKGFGCSSAGGASDALPPGKKDSEYSCEGDANVWSAGKQAWCCLKRKVGCREESGADTLTGCAARCLVDGIDASCKTRTAYAMRTSFAGHPDACELAHNLTLAQCPDCSGCVLADSGCREEAV